MYRLNDDLLKKYAQDNEAKLVGRISKEYEGGNDASVDWILRISWSDKPKNVAIFEHHVWATQNHWRWRPAHNIGSPPWLCAPNGSGLAACSKNCAARACEHSLNSIPIVVGSAPQQALALRGNYSNHLNDVYMEPIFPTNSNKSAERILTLSNLLAFWPNNYRFND